MKHVKCSVVNSPSRPSPIVYASDQCEMSDVTSAGQGTMLQIAHGEIVTSHEPVITITLINNYLIYIQVP